MLTYLSTTLLLVGAMLVGPDNPSATPTCCAKHAYCCSTRAVCCGESTSTHPVALEKAVAAETAAETADEVLATSCCAKRSYCCTVKRSCCGSQVTPSTTH
jgi:hypothetical protein